MRFCSRCGFALAGVAMLVENEGVIPQPGGLTAQTLPSSRKKVMTESGIFTLISWGVLLGATLAFDWGGPLESVAKIASVIFFCLGLIGLLRFLYGFLFVKDVIVQPASNAFPKAASQGAMSAASRHNALPPQRDFAVTDYPRRQNTQEMVARPSVTENTTRLLQDPPNDRGD
jgi:hypothetical protein